MHLHAVFYSLTTQIGLNVLCYGMLSCGIQPSWYCLAPSLAGAPPWLRQRQHLSPHGRNEQYKCAIWPAPCRR